MGTPDYIHVKYKCPRCFEEIEDHAQTKSLRCYCDSYELGDKIKSDYLERGILFAGSYCKKCNKEIYIGIKIEEKKLKNEISKFIFQDELPLEIQNWCCSAICSYLGDFKREDERS